MDKKILVSSLAAALMAGLTACGGGGGGYAGSSSGTTRVVTGAITAFGSVYVNGERFDTSSSSVYVEDSAASEKDLRVGMTVTVKSSSAGAADSIHFDDDAEGIVTSTAILADNTGTLEVMGQTVTVDSKTIFEGKGVITQASEIVAGNIVEVSGSSSGTGSVLATRLEVKAVDLATYLVDHPNGVEVKGIVKNHFVGSETFEIGSMTVTYTGAIIDDSMPAGSWDGKYVEVKSTEGIVAGKLVASKVELEDGGSKGEHEAEDEVEVKGAVSAVDASSITVNGHTFQVTASTVLDAGKTLADIKVGMVVEVEGSADASGQLIARKIELEDHDEAAELEVKGTVDSVTATSANEGTVVVGGATYKVTASTIMHDSATHDTSFNLSKLVAGDYVEIHYADISGVLTAVKLERKTP